MDTQKVGQMYLTTFLAWVTFQGDKNAAEYAQFQYDSKLNKL